MTNYKNCEYPLNILADVTFIDLSDKYFTKKSMEYGMQECIEEELVQIAELYYKEKKNLKEIAEIVSISYSCARDRLSRLQSHVGWRIRYFETHTYEIIKSLNKQVETLRKEKEVLQETVNKIYAIAAKESTKRLFVTDETSIYDVDFPSRVYYYLRMQTKWETVGDIIKLFENGEIYNVKGMGKVTLMNIRKTLISVGIDEERLPIKNN